MERASPYRVVIVGGGFGGLHTAKALARAPVDVTLIDRRNFHLFQPLLYQVATGGLSPGDISSPLRWILKRHRHMRVWLAHVTDFDIEGKTVILRDGEVGYDSLVVAAGASHHYFGHATWERHAPGLKSIEDATAIRRRVLGAFEAAEREPDPDRQLAWMTFVVVGAGPTGVELSGAVSELARDTLRKDFRAIDPTRARIVLLESTNRVLPTYPPSLSAKALRSLRRLGVSVYLDTLVTDISEHSVEIRHGGATERLSTRTVLWGAGVKASPLGERLARATGAEIDRAGRVMVDANLAVPGHPSVFVLGDLAHAVGKHGSMLPGTAAVAVQQGAYVGRVIRQRLANRATPPFRYLNRGNLATVGRAAAVADFGPIRFSGYPAWLLWLFVHIMLLVEFQNRVLVLVQWAWHYVTKNRGARLIAGPSRRPSDAE